MKYYGGTLKITNPVTLAKWIVNGQYQALLEEGYIYAGGCGRFRKEVCQCCKCRKLRKHEQRTN
jgi:hypothetical protein